MKFVLFFMFLFSSSLLLFAQQPLMVEKMKMSYEIKGESVFIQLSAPTEGWLLVGFNDKNEIVGSDLKMLRVRNGKVEVEDRFVVGLGKYPPDLQQGGQNNLEIISGFESNGITSVSFSFPLQNADKYDFQHEPGKEFWLVMAYAVEDDFEHHSIMRRHLKFQFN